MKPTILDISSYNGSILDALVEYKKSTKGLTPRGEEWLKDMIGRFIKQLEIRLTDVVPGHIVKFLAPYGDRPFQRHGLFRALKSLYRWLKRFRYIQDNPIDYIDTPKVPDRVLNTVTPEQVQVLIRNASCTRDRAIVSLLADSGARRSEMCNIQLQDLDLEQNRIWIVGKGGKEGFLIYGARTKEFLIQHITENNPKDGLFSLNYEGLKTMLNRLGAKTGIQCRPHDFRRGFATALRRMGVGELDIQQFGRWSSLEMVRRYTKAYTFENAVERYKPIVT